MRIRLRNFNKFVLFGFVLLSLSFSPLTSGSGFSKIEQRQKMFVINEIFDLSSTQMLSYQFPLWLDWIGSNARICIQGGILTGRTPTSLEVITVLDGVRTQHLFEHKHNLQNSYTF
ncbi:MAG: hypothetical protein ACFFC7_17340, partial [Candidatus Hermodarchaeota archaeon]